MLSWKEVFVIVLISTILFSLITRYGSKTGYINSTVLFAALLLVSISAARYYMEQNKEQFFFEVSPYKKCSQKGFYGRPLSFDYTLPECETQCNPY